jgi:hypothetical protein
MAVTANGQFVISASDDQSVRVWERGEELLVIEEEEEMAREKEMEESRFVCEL